MNRNLFVAKSVILVFIVIVFTIISYFMYFDVFYDAYARGYRYWVLKTELIVFPIYFIIAISHIACKIIKERIVGWSSVRLMAKYLIYLIILLVIFFILGMIFNDITSKGANINFK